MTKYKLAVLIALLSFNFIFSQSINPVNSNWVLSGRILSFEGGDSIKVSNIANLDTSIHATYEASSTVSDSAGNLLFFTNGVSVFDKHGNIIPGGNGTIISGRGDSSDFSIASTSIQGVMIVKHPLSKLYYIFSGDDANHNTTEYKLGLNYVTVDLNANNGLGQVSNSFNLTPNLSTSEALSACYHSNGVDIWIITQIKENQYEYNCFLLTKDGLNLNPVISTNTNPRSGIYSTGKGSFNINKPGRIIYDYYYTGMWSDMLNISIYDFDNSTGKVSSRKRLSLNTQGINDSFSYSSALSNNSKFLYFVASNKLYQLNIDSAHQVSDVLDAIEPISIAGINFNKASIKFGPNENIFVFNLTDSIYQIKADWDSELHDSSFFEIDNIVIPNNHNIGTPNSFIGEWDASNINYIQLDSLKDITCSSYGYLSGSMPFGTPPFSYTWNNDTSLTDSFYIPKSTGIFTLNITDSKGKNGTENYFIKGKFGGKPKLDFKFHLRNFRPGFTDHNYFTITNHSCHNYTGKVEVQFDKQLIQYYGFPEYYSSSDSTVYKNNLTINENQNSYVFKPRLKTLTNAQVGDTIHLKWIISLQGQEPYDTTIYISRPVVNGYDPNDITVTPEGSCDEKYIPLNQELNYFIRFQNTGNSEAINISILDTINSKLDLSTFKLISASFNKTQIIIHDDSIIEFKMDSILLVDSTTSAPKSKGYISFNIQPKMGVSVGDKISNRVGIYFDYNPVVLTNQVFNTMYNPPYLCSPTSSLEIHQDSKLYPNPGTDGFTITENYFNLQIFDLTGKLIPFENQGSRIVLKGPKGVYFIKFINSNNSIIVSKWIKR